MIELLKKLMNREDLTFQEAYDLIQWVMSEDAIAVQASALLILLQTKGITDEEMAGAADAMRGRVSKIRAPDDVIDTCSTGGNGISTFNISTCAAIIAAAAGAKVAKHGNRSNTRKSGSAEALQALGVNIDLSVEEVEHCLEEIDLCFCYAVNHHPAMRYAGPIRRELGVPTVFNLLGPLTNPAGAKNQLIGVPTPKLTGKMTEVLRRLKSRRILAVHGEDGLCELTVTAPTLVSELRDGTIRQYTMTAEEMGLRPGKLDDIRTESAEESAQMILRILSGEDQGTPRDMALINTSGALVVAGLADDLKQGVSLAAEAVDSGGAAEKLKLLIEFSQQPS